MLVSSLCAGRAAWVLGSGRVLENFLLLACSLVGLYLVFIWSLFGFYLVFFGTGKYRAPNRVAYFGRGQIKSRVDF
jgi:hypothetical protein